MAKLPPPFGLLLTHFHLIANNNFPHLAFSASMVHLKLRANMMLVFASLVLSKGGRVLCHKSNSGRLLFSDKAASSWGS